jgi:hypothetical protein
MYVYVCVCWGVCVCVCVYTGFACSGEGSGGGALALLFLVVTLPVRSVSARPSGCWHAWPGGRQLVRSFWGINRTILSVPACTVTELCSRQTVTGTALPCCCYFVFKLTIIYLKILTYHEVEQERVSLVISGKASVQYIEALVLQFAGRLVYSTPRSVLWPSGRLVYSTPRN